MTRPTLPTLVILPTYNEAGNIEAIVERVLRSADVHVLVADDNSPDGTGEIADKLAGADARVHVLHRPGKAGLGAAYVAGFGWALEHGYEAVVQMDADGSHLPEDMYRLLDGLDSADVVVGSRYIPGGRVENWPRKRELLSAAGNHYTRAVMGLPVRDATGGYRAFRASTLRRLELETVSSHGYCFQVDVARRALRAGLRITEVPITFIEREEGASKMTRGIVTEAVWRVTGWGLARRARQLASWRKGGAA